MIDVRSIHPAVKKASAKRLLMDFQMAAWMIQEAEGYSFNRWETEVFAQGMCSGVSSLTLKAALLTAFGG